MKKKKRVNKLSIIKIVLLIIVIILIVTVIYKIYQVKNFQKNLREITDSEKLEVINILNKNMNITSSDIIFGRVFERGDTKLVQVQIKEGDLRKSYLIDLEKNTLIREHHE